MRTLAQIDQFIIKKHAEGSVPGNIASHLGIAVSFIHGRMDVLGIDHEGSDRQNKFNVHRMWNLEGHELRCAIWERETSGAHDTLQGRY